MPFFKTAPGNGAVSNLGYDFNETDATEVTNADAVERLRKHPQFVEVKQGESRMVSRETQAERVELRETESEVAPAAPVVDHPVAEDHAHKRKPGRPAKVKPDADPHA